MNETQSSYLCQLFSPDKKRLASHISQNVTTSDTTSYSELPKRARRSICRTTCLCPSQITIETKNQKMIKTCPIVLDVVPYFSALQRFRSGEANNESELIELQEFNDHIVLKALQFLQTGQCNLDEISLADTLHIADYLRLDTLITHCVHTIHSFVLNNRLKMSDAHNLLLRHSLGIPQPLLYSMCDIAIENDYPAYITDSLKLGMCPNTPYELLSNKPTGLSLLMKAVLHGNTEISRCLIDHGAHVDYQCERTEKPSSFDEKDTPWIENYHSLKQKYVPKQTLNTTNIIGGSTALHIAVWRDDLQMVKLLFQSGCKILPDQDGETAVHIAAAFSNTDILQFLVQRAYHGLFNAHSNIMGTPLFRSILNPKADTLKFMIENGADPFQTDYTGFTVISYAAVSNNLESIRLLHEGLSVPLMELNDNRETALHQCASLGHIAVIEYCVKQDRQLLYIQDERGDTLLHVAVLYDQMQAARLLIDAGSQVNLANYLNEHPLHISLMENCTEIIPHLLEAGANPNAILNIRDTATPLTLAIMCGGETTLDYVQQLLQHGADPKLLHNKALTLALRENIHQKDEIVQKLLQKGACPNARCMGTPLLMDICAMPESSHLVKLLIKHGAEVNAINRQGQTALMVACAKENLEIVEILLKHGAKTELRTWHGLTARMILNTSQTSSQKILHLLNDYDAQRRLVDNLLFNS